MAQADVIITSAQMLVRVAIGEVRAVNQLERHAAYVGIHPCLVSGQVSRRPVLGPAALESLYQARTVGFQGQPGIEHPDPAPRVEQCLRASHTRRPGPDYVIELRVGRN